MSQARKLALTSLASFAFISLIAFEFIRLFYPDNLVFLSALNSLMILGHLIGLVCINTTVKLNTLMKNRLNTIGAIAFLVGVIMIITHISAYLLAISTIYIITISIYQFTKYSSRPLLSYLKLIWFILFLIGIVFKLNHFPGAFRILFGASVVIWLIIINYCYHFANKRFAQSL
jgi:hypothetical protein